MKLLSYEEDRDYEFFEKRGFGFFDLANFQIEEKSDFNFKSRIATGLRDCNLRVIVLLLGMTRQTLDHPSNNTSNMAGNRAIDRKSGAVTDSLNGQFIFGFFQVFAI